MQVVCACIRVAEVVRCNSKGEKVDAQTGVGEDGVRENGIALAVAGDEHSAFTVKGNDVTRAGGSASDGVIGRIGYPYPVNAVAQRTRTVHVCPDEIAQHDVAGHNTAAADALNMDAMFRVTGDDVARRRRHASCYGVLRDYSHAIESVAQANCAASVSADEIP